MSLSPKKLLLTSVSRMLTAKGVIASGIALWAGVIALCGWIVYLSYLDAVELAKQSSHNLLLAIERDLERTINSYDLSLQAAIKGSQDSNIMSLPMPLRSGALFDNSATARYFGVIVLLNAQGRVIADSSSMDESSGADFSDRKPYLMHKENPALDFWISSPHPSKRRAGTVEITISRRINAPDGSFAGIVVGTINIDYFQSLLSGLDLKRSGRALILMNDGSLLAREPYQQEVAGLNVHSGPMFKIFIKEHSGVIWGVSGIDGVNRLHVYKQLVHLPMIIDIAPSRSDILADWKGRSLLMLVLVIVFSLVVLPTTFLFARELRQRRRSELELRRQAHLDPMTGLDNRGTFDRALQKACAISMRTGSPLSLLFLDLDKFKAYNDTYGHQAGDAVLKRTTATAHKELQRSTDHFARYGGEEFVAILEGSDEAQAIKIAERIRTAIEDLKITHPSNPTGFVTISIGVASAQGNATPEMLINMADEALYDAKAAGRNRVMPFTPRNHNGTGDNN
jgi:diguanylate cyclase (GGDEF)-like protein